eukprot:491427_1
MSHKKRKIEEIFDEHEKMWCSSNKNRKIQSHKSCHRDFKIKYFQSFYRKQSQYCSICEKRLGWKAITLDNIHYQCFECFKINAVNEEKIDIINSVYMAINNVYNDLLIDKYIIHLIANYSIGFIVKCCLDNKCE